METWGSSGSFDPFNKVYEVSNVASHPSHTGTQGHGSCVSMWTVTVPGRPPNFPKDRGFFSDFDSFYFFIQLLFQLTIRSLSCTEIADDPVLVSRLKDLYDTLDVGTTPATVLVPWLPTPAMIKKLWATKEIYNIVNTAIRARETSGVSRDDTLQMLLDAGDEKLVVVGVRIIFMAFFFFPPVYLSVSLMVWGLSDLCYHPSFLPICNFVGISFAKTLTQSLFSFPALPLFFSGCMCISVHHGIIDCRSSRHGHYRLVLLFFPSSRVRNSKNFGGCFSRYYSFLADHLPRRPP